MRRLHIPARGRYSLAAQAAFLGGFAPATYDGPTTSLELAFPIERSWRPAAVEIIAEGDGVAVVSDGAPPDRLAEQVARMLSLDVDGSAFEAVAGHDAIAGELCERSGWLRPICFPSPYEAAVWGVLSQRTQMNVAARLRRRLADEIGSRVGGRAAFPAPQRLAELGTFPGIPALKLERLRGIAAAAQDGILDGERLRALSPAVALEELERLPGVGPFTAELILIRGAGAPDVLPTAEPRLAQAVARAYGKRARLETIAEAWRPYRSWVCVLLRSFA